ncbi:drug-efflux protein [Geotalea uraniireducens]|uniref:Drug-efflux protein n=1 Tax=Geotalea uraniireducens TaxID=351604 RepID=A0ABN6VXA5_9BACT|nr:macrolide transporter subunit MacA [Geotalea uraniireducens]BDV44002.1 drug-efflux protein [Geotalea uraniireducens]
MTKTTRRNIAIVLAAVLVLSGTGLLLKRLFFTKETPAYITATVAKADIEDKVLASGTLTALKTVEVGAQVSGQLKKLYVALGDQVKKGQLLAEIDPVLQQNALRDAAAALDDVRAQKRAKQALLHQYDLAYKRQSQLAAVDAAARADLESAQAQLESTRADIAALDAQINKARIAVDTAQANLGYTRIAAPMDGVVITIVTEEGQTVNSAQTAPTILKLADLDTITVKAQISEADITRVRPGQTAYFTILGDSDTRHYGRLRAIEPAPDSTSSSSSSSSSSTSSTAIYYNGLFDVPNPHRQLRVSMTAQVSIVLSEARQVLCIPAAALGNKGKDGRYPVTVLRDGHPEARTVRIGINNNVQAQVLDGLRAGEQVIVGDSSQLPAGQRTPGGPPPRG